MQGSFKFEKRERIFRSEDFKKVLKLGRRRSSKNFILFIYGNTLEFNRLGVIVKKEVGHAVLRNRVKRRLREFFRLHKQEIKGPIDLVIMVKKGYIGQTYPEIEEELRRVLIS